ncbi:MAG: aminomethyl-transferring glycine dehydrogenase subunit GcvPB [Thaumarchaeota archaeon]|nr:aminomethyl-transferring glycine dehydrogenase subunit GcvPB [Nitrososphaerota archaeon]
MKLIFEYEEQTTGYLSDENISIGLPNELIRNELPLPNVSEIEVIRHYTNLSKKNFGVDLGFYPLGSCTMKYNPKINEDVAALEGFRNLHPLSKENCIQGSLQLMWELEQYLKEITGMDTFSLQPAAGAQGELLGLMIAKVYFKQKNKKRAKVIIPDSAHGTNPATAAMCKYETIVIPSDIRGNIDLQKFKQSLNDEIAVVMLTNPNTLGLFEENILEVCDLAHNNGTLMYCDGANMNALLGITRPGDQGFDMIHLNLHKSFSTPHGGGGPGAGVLGVKSFLSDYLPLPRIIKQNNKYIFDNTKEKSVGKIRSFYGNFGMLVRACSYIMSWGSNIRKVSEHAVLNANYLLSLLKEVYDLPYNRKCAHEFVISSEKFGEKSALNIAKRLLDYGFHPPTIYFPLIVQEALMIEPTETESKETLDRFAFVLRSIAHELRENPQVVNGAPYTTPVGRLDEITAARKPNLRWAPPK